MNSAIPDIDNCCEKETYAFYGLAAYCAQVLEHSAVNLAFVLRLPEVGLVSQTLFDELYTSLTRKTFGQLLKSSRKVLQLSRADEQFLEEALELRNTLVHHYFRLHAEDFVSEVGRQEMKKELQLIISKFDRADKMLENQYLPLWQKYGVTEQFIEDQLSEMQERAKLRDVSA